MLWKSTIIKLLEKEYPDTKTALEFKNPLEMLVSTILSAQCTDKRVNIVTKKLFKKYKKPEDYATADIPELENDIHSTGFYKNKAKNIKAACNIIIEKFNSGVPDTMEDILTLPGVARKTANIVLWNSYGIISGIAVDTHVKRLTGLLELTKNRDPKKIEEDLMKITPEEYWAKLTNLIVEHGRSVCIARRPRCEICVLNKLCMASKV